MMATYRALVRFKSTEKFLMLLTCSLKFIELIFLCISVFSLCGVDCEFGHSLFFHILTTLLFFPPVSFFAELSPSSDQADPKSFPSTTAAAVKFQLGKVRELRLELDRLRSIVSDKFAEEMGRRLTCNPQ